MYEHLNLKAWPFQTVPDEDFAQIWAGRKQTKKDLEHLIWRMQFAPKSSIRLLWANLGMGKTHTLLHIRHLCKQTQGKLVPVYAVMPNNPSNFIDIYRAIVSDLPFNYLGDQLVKVGIDSSGSVALHPMFSKSPGIVSALLAMRSGDMERVIAAQQWLRAQPGLTAKDLRTVGVSYRIKTTEDAIIALSVLIKLISYKVAPVGKLVIMLDEYQRIGELRQSVRQSINAGLHTLYNANPNGLEIFLSFSFGNQDNVMFLVSNELKSRAELQSIKLDVLNEGEALDFFRDLLTQFRVNEDSQWAFPFSPNAVKEMIVLISKEKTLTPRRLMLYANHILMEKISSSTEKAIGEISVNDIREVLSNSNLGAMDQD